MPRKLTGSMGAAVLLTLGLLFVASALSVQASPGWSGCGWNSGYGYGYQGQWQHQSQKWPSQKYGYPQYQQQWYRPSYSQQSWGRWGDPWQSWRGSWGSSRWSRW